MQGRSGLSRGRWLVCLGVLAGVVGIVEGQPLTPEPPPVPAPPSTHAMRVPLVHVTSGGQPIRLSRADVAVDVQGSLAHTVMTLAFTNPNARVLEGELQFPLRAGQSVTGFALEMADGTMMPAVAVPKARGREVFEEITRRGVDPALLEQTGGDNFRLRLYPLRPGVARHVRIELSQWLAVGADQRLAVGVPLDFGATTVDQLSLHVRLHDVASADVRFGDGLEGVLASAHGSDAELSLERSDFTARPDITRSTSVSWPARHGDAVMRARVDGRGYFHAEVQVPDVPRPRARPDDITLVWDASGSGALRDHDREFKLLAALFAWQPDAKVHLRIVRDAAEPERSFDVRHGDWRALRGVLETVAYDGATNASLWSARPVRHPAASLALLFSDGLGNWGDTTLVVPTNVRSFAVMSAAGNSSQALRQWADERGGRVLDLSASDTAAAMAAIQQCGRRLVRIEGDGFEQAAVASHLPDSGRLVVAGRFTGATAHLDLVLQDADGREHHQALAIAAPSLADEGTADVVAQRWASLRVAELMAQPRLHRREIESLGAHFGVVTPETSLIVLESLADFQSYDITPPAGPLRQAYLEAGKRASEQKSAEVARHLDELAGRQAGLESWWDTVFPKMAAKPAGPPALSEPRAAAAEPDDNSVQRVELASSSIRRIDAGAPAAAGVDAPIASPATANRVPAPSPKFLPPPPRNGPPPMSPPSPIGGLQAPSTGTASFAATTPSRVAATGAAPALAKTAEDAPGPLMHIVVQAWSADAAGARRLADATPADRYGVYLDERLEAARSPAFYLDAASVFAAKGERVLALRVLSNLAELEIEDRGLLRVLAYRLQEMGATAEAVRALQRVAELAPDEPQSWRDLGLAQAADGAWQKAVDALWTAASGRWNNRFGDVDLIALGELDAIAATHAGLDLSAVDTRLRRNLPLDVRVALAWDTDSTDIDLWVKDPAGEWVSYQKPASRQGGRITRDVTNGYGPEVFSLKSALPGRYEVHAKYYGSHRQVLGNGTTVMMRLTTGFGTHTEQHRDVILRLEDARDDVVVGSFDVGAPAR